jgi:hypothetical protein
MGMKGKFKLLSAMFFVMVLLTGVFAIHDSDSKEEPASSVKEINLEVDGTKIVWEVDGYSSSGFKIVWSKNKNPEYPTRDGDKYHYFSSPEKSEDELEAFSGEGYYYVRVCEYLGGRCGLYSNEEMILIGEAEEGYKPDEKKEEFYEEDKDEEIEEDVESEKIDEVKDGSEELGLEISCDFGCYVNEQCYPLGYRVGPEYCNDNRTFVSQIEDEESCDNNFQCESNLCVDGNCISGSLIQKVLSWFRRVF